MWKTTKPSRKFSMNTTRISLPYSVEQILARLEAAGFEAYAVGGCVRDSLLGREVKDWDLCSAATPEQATELFPDLRVLPTGIEHGTVTLLWESVPHELTMFRTEADYDGRTPQTVRLARTLDEDVQRRDFTVNALAYSPTRGLRDLCGGQADLSAGLLKAVGEPQKRFSEDYLRILRALRFSANYGFIIEKNTASAMEACAEGLSILSGERVWQELEKLLRGQAAGEVLSAYGCVLRGLGSGWEDFSFSAADGQTLDTLPQNLCGRLAFLLRNLTKKDHVLAALRCPTEVKKRVSRIWERAEHFPADPTRKALCRWLHGFERASRAEDWFCGLYLAVGCDAGESTDSQIAPFDSAETMRVDVDIDPYTRFIGPLEQILKTTPLDVCDLPLTGADLIAAGIPKGPIIGEFLEKVLEMAWESAEFAE